MVPLDRFTHDRANGTARGASGRRAGRLAIVLAAVAPGVACNEPATPNAPPSAPGAPMTAPLTAARAQPVDAAASPLDRDAGVDAEAPPAAAAEPCPATPWAMYAHDPARTSASDGCATGPLAVTWRAEPTGTCGYRFRPGRFLHAIADERSVFASLDCGGAPALQRLTTAGEPVWTFGRGDYGYGTWPAFAGSAILSADDGLYLVDRETGKYRFHDLDVWGEPAVVGETFYVDNTYQLDGYGPFLAATGVPLKWTWVTSAVTPGKNPHIARTGGFAVLGERVVHAAAMGGRGVPWIAAHEAASGHRLWVAPGAWPESAPSAAEGRVFVVERWHGENADRLVARSLEDGSVAWSSAVPWSRGPSPVIAGKLVIIHGAEGVCAYERDSGEVAWRSPLPKKAPFTEPATTMAAAMGSGSLVVTSGARVVLLALADGHELWSGAVATGQAVVERPIVVGRTVYVASNGALVRLDPEK